MRMCGGGVWIVINFALVCDGVAGPKGGVLYVFESDRGWRAGGLDSRIPGEQTVSLWKGLKGFAHNLA